MIIKEHLTKKGLNKIVALKINSPNGVFIKLQETFSDHIKYLQNKSIYNYPETINKQDLNIHWLVGFQIATSSLKGELIFYFL